MENGLLASLLSEAYAGSSSQRSGMNLSHSLKLVSQCEDAKVLAETDVCYRVSLDLWLAEKRHSPLLESHDHQSHLLPCLHFAEIQ